MWLSIQYIIRQTIPKGVSILPLGVLLFYLISLFGQIYCTQKPPFAFGSFSRSFTHGLPQSEPKLPKLYYCSYYPPFSISCNLQTEFKPLKSIQANPTIQIPTSSPPLQQEMSSPLAATDQKDYSEKSNSTGKSSAPTSLVSDLEAQSLSSPLAPYFFRKEDLSAVRSSFGTPAVLYGISILTQAIVYPSISSCSTSTFQRTSPALYSFHDAFGVAFVLIWLISPIVQLIYIEWKLWTDRQGPIGRYVDFSRRVRRATDAHLLPGWVFGHWRCIMLLSLQYHSRIVE